MDGHDLSLVFPHHQHHYQCQLHCSSLHRLFSLVLLSLHHIFPVHLAASFSSRPRPIRRLSMVEYHSAPLVLPPGLVEPGNDQGSSRILNALFLLAMLGFLVLYHTRILGNLCFLVVMKWKKKMVKKKVVMVLVLVFALFLLLVKKLHFFHAFSLEK